MTPPSSHAPQRAGDAPVEISVVVPCRGHAAALAGLLVDLAGQMTDRRFEIIVVDAAADDAVLAAADVGGARVVRSDIALLPGEARDLGATHAHGTVLAFIDADCRPDEGWVEAAAAALVPGVRLVGGPVSDLRPLHLVARADNLLQFADLPRTRPAGRIHMLPACNVALKATDYRALGGFKHAQAVATGEDAAFCERAEERWPGAIRFEPPMAVRHAGRTSFLGFLHHHHAFGYSRGRLRLLLSDRQARLGQMGILFPVVVFRRTAFVLGCVLRYRPKALPAALILVPLIVPGIVAWTVGFRRGLADGGREEPVPISVARGS